jgi:hypothetical protein
VRKEFEMTQEDLDIILNACKPTPAMWGSGGVPLFATQQENANEAWKALGKKMGFDGMTCNPVPGKGQRFFTAEST